ncbi:class I SAM-dependent methyltransferase [Mycoplasma sp. P36-A1]|uniref:class I SAM-dependent methyltransferase n=1 Tax=Mycoplasma sp. P36-A1 TaxID=3252900 RepID=UPI003C309EB3
MDQDITRQLFDAMSTNYDNSERVYIANQISYKIKSLLNDTKSKTALEVGSGTGLVGLSLINEFESITLNDISECMLKVIDEKIKNFNIVNVKTNNYNYLNIEKDSQKFDYIFVIQTLLHIKDTKKCLESLSRRLNDDGHLIIIDYVINNKVKNERIHNGFDREQLVKILEENLLEIKTNDMFLKDRVALTGIKASLFVIEATNKKRIIIV